MYIPKSTVSELSSSDSFLAKQTSRDVGGKLYEIYEYEQEYMSKLKY